MTAQRSQLQAECAGRVRAWRAFPGGRPLSVLPHTLLRLSLLARHIMNGATVWRQRQHFVLFSHTSQWSKGALTLEMLLRKQGGVVGLRGRGSIFLLSLALIQLHWPGSTNKFVCSGNTPDPTGPGSYQKCLWVILTFFIDGGAQTQSQLETQSSPGSVYSLIKLQFIWHFPSDRNRDSLGRYMVLAESDFNSIAGVPPNQQHR